MTKLDAPMDSGGNDIKKAGPKGQAQSDVNALKTVLCLLCGEPLTSKADQHALQVGARHPGREARPQLRNLKSNVCNGKRAE